MFRKTGAIVTRIVTRQQAQTATNLPMSFFSTAAEPKFMVRKDLSVDPRLVKVPYLRDTMKQEIYAKHIMNPEKWTLQALSQHFHTSIDRTKAVIVLMHKRYDMIRSKGFNVKIDENHHTISVEIPSSWKGLYEKYLEDPTQDIEKALQSYNESVTEEHRKLGINGEKAKEIIENIKDHERRTANLEFHNKHMEEVLNGLKASGVDAHTFQETANDVTMTGNRKSLKESYYPSLFGDDDFEETKKRLLKRIADETMARVDYNLEHYNEKYTSPATDNVDVKKTSPENVSRWKLAFRDLAQVDTKAGQNDITTTTIRTRQGE